MNRQPIIDCNKIEVYEFHPQEKHDVLIIPYYSKKSPEQNIQVKRSDYHEVSKLLKKSKLNKTSQELIVVQIVVGKILHYLKLLA